MRIVWQDLARENLAGKRESSRVTYSEAARERQICYRGSQGHRKHAAGKMRLDLQERSCFILSRLLRPESKEPLLSRAISQLL